jgi:hypothetical protein
MEKIMRILLMIICILLICPSLWAQRSLNDPNVRQAINALKSEPSIKEVQEAALKFYHADPDTVNSLRTRAQLKSLLPDVNVRFRTGNNRVYIDTFDYITGDPNGLSGTQKPYITQNDDSTGNAKELEFSGAWSFSRLMFNPEVLDVSSMAALQEGILKEVTRLYYTRRRLQIDLILSDPTDLEAILSKELRLEEVTANLNALTNHFLSNYQQSVVWNK